MYMWGMCIWKGIWVCRVYVCVFGFVYVGGCVYGMVYMSLWVSGEISVYIWKCVYGGLLGYVRCICVYARVCIFLSQ